VRSNFKHDLSMYIEGCKQRMDVKEGFKKKKKKNAEGCMLSLKGGWGYEGGGGMKGVS
jgi:hypothetical protein